MMEDIEIMMIDDDDDNDCDDGSNKIYSEYEVLRITKAPMKK